MLNFKNPGRVEFYLDDLSGKPIASVNGDNSNMMVKGAVTPGVKGKPMEGAVE